MSFYETVIKVIKTMRISYLVDTRLLKTGVILIVFQVTAKLSSGDATIQQQRYQNVLAGPFQRRLQPEETVLHAKRTLRNNP